MRFEIDIFAAGILFLSLFAFALLKIFLFSPSSSSSSSPSPSPSFAFSRLKDLKYPSWRSRLALFPAQLRYFALVSLMIAFLDPHFLFPKSTTATDQNASLQNVPREGIAIYLVLDQSGSMGESVPIEEKSGREESIPKIDLLKKVTKKFILSHPSDLIGLVSFARIPKVLVPLTLDQKALLDQLNKIQTVKNPQEDGTAIGYAIFKTASILSATRRFTDNLQKKGKFTPYHIKSAVIIVVTDGFQDPSRLDLGNKLRTMELDDAAAYAKKEDIRLYVVNIDPALSSVKFAPERKLLQKIASLTGGKFFMVGGDLQLENVYEAINRLEKGTIVEQVQIMPKNAKSDYTRRSLYPFFIGAGLAALFISFFLHYTLLRPVP